MTTNPYNKKTQEPFFLAFDHGSNAESRDECPYQSDDEEERHYYAAWMKGFQTRKGKKPRKVEQPTEAIAGAIDSGTLGAISTDDLKQELIKRTSKELIKLKQRREQLLNTLKDLSDNITKLEILCGK